MNKEDIKLNTEYRSKDEGYGILVKYIGVNRLVFDYAKEGMSKYNYDRVVDISYFLEEYEEIKPVSEKRLYAYERDGLIHWATECCFHGISINKTHYELAPEYDIIY